MFNEICIYEAKIEKQADSVDYALMELLAREDIVATQDFGLAAMVIGKGAIAINLNGLIYFPISNMTRCCRVHCCML